MNTLAASSAAVDASQQTIPEEDLRLTKRAAQQAQLANQRKRRNEEIAQGNDEDLKRRREVKAEKRLQRRISRNVVQDPTHVPDETELKIMREAKMQRKQQEREQKKAQAQAKETVNGVAQTDELSVASQAKATGDVDQSQNGPSSVISETAEGHSWDTPKDSISIFPLPRMRPSMQQTVIQAAAAEQMSFDPHETQTLDDARLDQQLCLRLKNQGIESLFAVQKATMEAILGTSRVDLYEPYRCLRDICVAAPTGSGKTLSYVLPIIQTLYRRRITQMRALVVLPTKDLVSQVRETFESVMKGSGLKLASMTGAHSFAHEQSTLLQKIPRTGFEDTCSDHFESLIDILICTPGRLVDHIQQTDGFTLQHVRFLVIDEADRLTDQSFHGWLDSVHGALNPAVEAISSCSVLAPTVLPPHYSDCYTAPQSSYQQLLFSATLSNDPTKLGVLRLKSPIFLCPASIAPTSEQTVIFPALLRQYYFSCAAVDKPLNLAHLLSREQITQALCFTRTIENAVRLAKLLDAFYKIWPNRQSPKIRAFTGQLSQSQRHQLLSNFKKGVINVLICSDVMSRGLDVPTVTHVISYDAPMDLTKYVHRVGRTARAGRDGQSWTMLEPQEVRHFKKALGDNFSALKKYQVHQSIESMRRPYEMAMRNLSKIEDD